MCQYMSTFVQAILQEFIFFMLQYVTRIYFYTGNYQEISIHFHDKIQAENLLVNCYSY
jgi:hypothetical protein